MLAKMHVPECVEHAMSRMNRRDNNGYQSTKKRMHTKNNWKQY